MNQFPFPLSPPTISTLLVSPSPELKLPAIETSIIKSENMRWLTLADSSGVLHSVFSCCQFVGATLDPSGPGQAIFKAASLPKSTVGICSPSFFASDLCPIWSFRFHTATLVQTNGTAVQKDDSDFTCNLILAHARLA